MKLLLIRHAETVDNIAQVYAGVTDSPLTVHGSLQAERLGSHLALTRSQCTHVFTSDLQRAWKTAESILIFQQQQFGSSSSPQSVTQLALLREQDLGPLERKAFKRAARGSLTNQDDGTDSDNTSKAGESKLEMSHRADSFLDKYVIPILLKSTPRAEPVVAVVSHGLLLSSLWKCLLKRFAREQVMLNPAVVGGGFDGTRLEHLGPWSNTGFLELEIQRLPLYMRASRLQECKGSDDVSRMDLDGPQLNDWMLTVDAVNYKEHLQGMKRTGGGVGSSRHDDSQPRIGSFFKRKRVD